MHALAYACSRAHTTFCRCPIAGFAFTNAGTRFFPGFVNERRRTALDAAALGWQAEGRARMRVLERLTLASDQAALLPKQIGGALCRELRMCACVLCSFARMMFFSTPHHLFACLTTITFCMAVCAAVAFSPCCAHCCYYNYNYASQRRQRQARESSSSSNHRLQRQVACSVASQRLVWPTCYPQT